MTTTPERRTATLSEQVAEEIRAWLGRRRMSQAQLSRAMGQSQMWVSDRLRGIQPIDLDDVQRFALVLGVTVFDLLPSPEEAGRAAVPVKKGSPALKEPFRPRVRSTMLARHPDLPASPVGSGRVDFSRPVSAVPAKRRRPQLVRADSRRPMSA